ncbi:MAG TPA: hypothetical protein VMT83_05065 [Burkholderiaceae bacterium]|nr:hypothetical protein [Burkholderiaceae bacterium]
MKPFAVSTFLAALLTACATPAPPIKEISAPFDLAQAKRLLREGPNTIRGNALMRKRGGDVVTCAGRLVRLVPATKYAEQRMLVFYGSSERGRQELGPECDTSLMRCDSDLKVSTYRFNPDPPEYSANVREQRCDAQGDFVFERVADGDFFVVTQITWETSASRSYQGGNLMQRVSVAGGKSVSIVLAQ